VLSRDQGATAKKIASPTTTTIMTATRCFIVSGRVQGVGFRAWTQAQAEQLGLAGWAANLPDGRVEVVAMGDGGQVEALRARLEHGPRLARVTGVEEAVADAALAAELRALSPARGFTTR
jgi:acylphosphatase